MTTQPDTPLDAESPIPLSTDASPPQHAMNDAGSQLADQMATEPAQAVAEVPAKPERKRVWWMTFLAWSILAVLVALFGTLLVALPFAGADPTSVSTELGRLPLIVGGAFICLWTVFFGACFGSFVNCMAYRLPRGVSTTSSNSACPKCHSKLRWYENLPIYGWLALNGQCGSCNQRIPVRYFLVELYLAISFTMIAYGDLLSGGIRIPLRPAIDMGMFGFVMNPDMTLWPICAFHLAAIVVLWLFALFSWDRFATPNRAAVLPLAALVVAASFWSEVIPVSVLSMSMPREVGLASLWDSATTSAAWARQSALPIWSLGLVTSLAGLASGAAIGWLGSFGQPGTWRQMSLVSAYAVVGATIGWQGLLSVALINSVLVWGVRMLPGGRHSQPFVVALPVAFLVHLWNWPLISTLTWWPGVRTHWSVYPIAALVVIAIHQAAWRVGRKSREASQPQDEPPGEATDEETREVLPETITNPAEQPPVPSTTVSAVE